MSDHFDGRRYFNPGGANGQPFWRVPQLMAARRTPWPAHVEVTPQTPPPPANDDDVVITFVGHATFLIQTSAGNILTDPVFVERASPLSFAGPRRVRQPGVRLEALPPIALVLLSHNHYDHCDLVSLRTIEQRWAPQVLTLKGNGPLLRSAGVTKIEELDWWEPAKTSPMPVWAAPAQHFSARGPFDRNRALWGSFVIELKGKRLFFAGDSGYGPHFRDIRSRFGAMDAALLPIGAYEPRWFMKDIHMNPEEAVQVHQEIESKRSIAMHFGTFQLTPEGIDAPVEGLAQARRAAGLDAEAFRALDVGQSVPAW